MKHGDPIDVCLSKAAVLAQLKKLSPDYKNVPVIERIALDNFKNSEFRNDPINIFRKFKNISQHCFILESLEDKQKWGRWTFLGFNPKLEVSCINGNVTIKNGTNITIFTEHPADYLKNILNDNKSPTPQVIAKYLPEIGEMPPFSGGLVGYFSFEYIKYSEPTLSKIMDSTQSYDGEAFKDFDLMLFDKIICWDHLKQELNIIVNIKTDALKENYNNAIEEIKKIKRIILKGEEAQISDLKINSEFKELFSKEDYCKMVEKGKYYIKEGDIFQVVLANQMSANVEGSIFNTYKILRKINPSPYMFYFSSDDIEIAGASPETLVKLQDGKMWTFPLAGTRPRGIDEISDKQLEAELLADPKEIAEHNMLVDLGRNDLGKLCEFGSVNVEKYMLVERFSHVMHIGSTVCGTIKKEHSGLDAINAVLPAGTLSGAPKIRACEIIAELEKTRRGIYGGAIGYLDFNGNMDTCISIRIAYKKDGKVFVRSGAGIVADSVPQNEYEECRNKMKAVLGALEQSA
ncbi:MAG: anthranilate synthase component I [Termitinemataceae bacterium]|nr:MAG: anthranilate synthase component I [Termitinemataceae bacterium]